MSDSSRSSRRVRESRYKDRKKSKQVVSGGTDEDDVCCVCGGQIPPPLQHKRSSSSSAPLIQWAECDSCQLWVHLVYCSKVRKVGPDDTFLCPSCQPTTKARKEVDYSQFGAGEEDFDDDFADMTPPPGKRQKMAKEPKVKKEKKKEKPQKTKLDIHKAPSRKSLDEKVYEREMQLAMELSRQDASQSPKENGLEVNNEASTGEVAEDALDARPCTGVDKSDSDAANDEDEMPVLKPVKPIPSKKQASKSKPKQDPKSDEIEVLEEDVQEGDAGGRRKRRAAAKAITKMVYKDEEAEEEDASDVAFEDEEEDGEEEEEEEEDGDSDFEGHWNKNKKKRKVKSKNPSMPHVQSPSKPKPKPRLSATVTPVNKGRGKPILKSAIKLPSEHHHSPTPSCRATPSGPLIIRKPNWMPSDGGKSPLGGVSVKSPGNLRLGLSKKSRVKPLHASVKIPQ